MSDDEEYNYESGVEEDEEGSVEGESSPPKQLFKPSIAKIGGHVKPIGGNEDFDDDAVNDDPDEEVEDDEEADEQDGGADSDSNYDENTDDDDAEIEVGEEGEVNEKVVQSKSAKAQKPKRNLIAVDDEEEDDDGDEDNYMQKFDNQMIKNYVDTFHPECFSHNYEEISKLSIVVKNADGIIVDPLHKTIPYLTKYERARVIGQRAKQIETGAKPLVKVPENVIDSHIIAELEIREKKIPFIIRRPIPSGGCEYWNLRDLELIIF